MLKYCVVKERSRPKYQVDKTKPLIDQIKEGGLAHQKRFHFWEFDTSVETDPLVEAIWDDFTHGKRHVKITGVNRSENTISVEFEQKMCYRFGIHKIGPYMLELIKKREIDTKVAEERAKKKQERQSKWCSFQRGNL